MALGCGRFTMQAEEVERWKLKIRNSSMAILKDVQKLLTCSREGDSEKIASISSEIASNARELIDTIQEQVSDRTEAGKQVLQTMEQMKRSIVVTMKACESITSHSSDSEQNALKEECKIVAGNIKLIHQHASALKPSDFVRDESDSEDSLISSGIVSPRLRDAIDKVHDHSSLAHSSLQGLESASIDKDQQSLVSHAKALSAQCSELLQLARKFKFEALVRSSFSFSPSPFPFSTPPPPPSSTSSNQKIFGAFSLLPPFLPSSPFQWPISPLMDLITSTPTFPTYSFPPT